MRKWWWTFVVMGLSSPAILAQQPATQGGAQAQGANTARSGADMSGRLDSILASWEASMSSVRSTSAQVTHTLVNKVLKDQEVFEGTAQFMKPNMAILDLKMKGRPQEVEHVICTGTFAYQFNPGTKIIKVYELKTGLSGQDNFLPFLQGMKAQDVKARYDLSLVKPYEDNNWIYIQILPRLPEDKADFQKARLVLSKQNYMPRELRFLDVNGNENIWDIPKIQPNDPQVTRNTFTAPKLPSSEWHWERVPAMPNPSPPRTDLPPRVIRPNQ